MKRKFFKSAAAVLAVTMAFSGLPVGAYALDTSESVPETSVTADVTIPVEPTTSIYPTDPIEPTIPVYPTQPVEPTEPVIVNYPEITGFSNTAKGTKISWSKYNSAVKYRYMSVKEALGAASEKQRLQALHTILLKITQHMFIP